MIKTFRDFRLFPNYPFKTDQYTNTYLSFPKVYNRTMHVGDGTHLNCDVC